MLPAMKKWLWIGAAVLLPLIPVASVQAGDFSARFVAAAMARTNHRITYDGTYQRISYPLGDVAADRGVCSDVVIRVYRALGIDLQRRVHEDMRVNFEAYPTFWGLRRPDHNIDHRRVPNLQTFFRRQGAELPISDRADDYRAGDLVTWVLPGNLPHMGIVVGQRSGDGARPLIVHNIGDGPKLEDFLFVAKITGHYRYGPSGHQ